MAGDINKVKGGVIIRKYLTTPDVYAIGQYNETLPNLSDGDHEDIQLDEHGRIELASHNRVTAADSVEVINQHSQADSGIVTLLDAVTTDTDSSVVNAHQYRFWEIQFKLYTANINAACLIIVWGRINTATTYDNLYEIYWTPGKIEVTSNHHYWIEEPIDEFYVEYDERVDGCTFSCYAIGRGA